MKRQIISGLMIFALVLFFSCSTNGDNDGMAKVTIDFGSTQSRSASLPDDIVKVHVAVFAGSTSPDDVFLKQTFKTSEATLLVTAGVDRVFLVVTEHKDGYAYHVGYSKPMDLAPDETVDVSISMTVIPDLMPSWSNDVVSWPKAIQANKYICMSGDSIFYEGPSREDSLPGGADGELFKVRAYYEVFDLYTDWSTKEPIYC